MRTCKHCCGAIPANCRPHTQYCSQKCRHSANNQKNIERKRDYNLKSRAKHKASRLAAKQEKFAREMQEQQRQIATLQGVRAIGAVAAQWQHVISPFLGAEYNIY